MAKRFTRAEIRRILGETCTDEIENELVALHLGVVDPLKEDLDKYKADAEKVPDLQKQIDELSNGDYKGKYEKEHAEFEAYKKDIDAKNTRTAKENAAKAFFEAKGITGANLDIAMRGAKDEIYAIELDGDNIKDTRTLDELVSGTYAGLIVKTTTQGANTATPPTNTGGTTLTKADIYKKDENGRYVMSTEDRQRALAQIIEQKGKH